VDEARTTVAEVRPLAPAETEAAARLHLRELPHEFLTRLGRGFLARYYRAFVESPHAVALAAVDRGSGGLAGVLIGTLDTRAHYSYLVRRHGLALAGHAALRALGRPSLALELLRTRAVRYLRGIVRHLRRAEGGPEEPSPERVGFMAFVAVDRARRGGGGGGALIAAYEKLAFEARLDRLELVTLPDGRGAGPFYERRGWEYAGERVSRSGERYALYVRRL
jgi:ribosomal protein S18 acetylase RimI-like enzyme